jgi:hypothetical protein
MKMVSDTKEENMKTKMVGMMVVVALMALIGCSDGGNTPPPAHEHQWGEWVTTTPATCTVEGVQTRVCALDSTHIETQPIAIDPDAHQWGEWTQSEDGQIRICTHNSAHKETRPVFTLDANRNLTVTLEYNKDESEVGINKLKAAVKSFANSQVSSSTITKDQMVERGGNYKIIVKYDGTTFDGFVATDGQTVTVHNTWLLSESSLTTNTTGAIREAFNAMLEIRDGATTPADTPRTLTFGTDCKVTIKSNDQFTAAEWDTLCDKAHGVRHRLG